MCVLLNCPRLSPHLAVSERVQTQAGVIPEFQNSAPLLQIHFQFAKAGYRLYQAEALLKTESTRHGSNEKRLGGDPLERL